MNEIRRNDEHWKDNLIGCTFTKQFEAAIMQRHAQELTAERIETRYRNLQKGLPAVAQSISEGAFVAVTDKKGAITDIGFNCADDLILDNFGVWLASFIRTPILAGVTAISLIDDANSSQAFNIYYTAATNVMFNSIGVAAGTYLRLGSGTTPPATDDYHIETALETAPESGYFGTSVGIFGGSAISFSAAVSAGGSGTVTEMGFFGNWCTTTPNTAKTIMLFHDLLSEGVSYTAGGTLNASYSILL